MILRFNFNRLARFVGPVVMWMGIIFLFSALPTQGASRIYWQDFIVKKSAHVIEYAVLTTLTYRALMEYGVDRRRAAVYSVLFASVYGATDEYHQSFTPGREPHVRDIMFDTIGALLSITIIWNILPKAPPRLRSWAKSYQLI